MTQATFPWCKRYPTEQQILEWDKQATYRAIGVLEEKLGEEKFRNQVATLKGIDINQVTPTSSWDYDELRQTLVSIKEDIGAPAMQELLGDNISTSVKNVKQYISESKGETRPCSTVLLVPNYTAEQFVTQFPLVFFGQYYDNHPEHFAFGDEPTEGDDIPDHYTVEFVCGEIHFVKILMHDDSKAVVDIESPFHLVASAVTKDGTKIAGITHQYVDTPDGLEIRLHIEAPVAFKDDFILRHQEHFAVEFYNALKKMEPRPSLQA
jgi:hypothetical protein